jgi:multidrug transporter EmrE-like cation transporter
MSYVDIGLIVLTEIIGDFGYKKFADNGGMQNFAVGTVGYIGVIYTLIRSLQGSQVLVVNAAWDGLSALVESIAAIIILGEGFDDPYKYLGIVFIILGLFLLKLPIVNQHKFIFPKFFIDNNKSAFLK